VEDPLVVDSDFVDAPLAAEAVELDAEAEDVAPLSVEVEALAVAAAAVEDVSAEMPSILLKIASA
jgi:hypothetical protein